MTHASDFSVARIEDLLRWRYTMPNEQLFWRQDALRVRQEGTVENTSIGSLRWPTESATIISWNLLIECDGKVS